MNTPRGKQVRTMYQKVGATIGAGLSESHPAADFFFIQDDITVIGVTLNVELNPLAELDSGILEIIADVSRAASMSMPGAIVELQSYIAGRSVTVGIGTSEVCIGDPISEIHVMFPPGYGIDMNDGEYLYLNYFIANGMANDHSGYIRATVYYVER